MKKKNCFDVSDINNAHHLDECFHNATGKSSDHGHRGRGRHRYPIPIYPPYLTIPYSPNPRLLKITDAGKKYLSVPQQESIVPDYNVYLLTAMSDGNIVSDWALRERLNLPSFDVNLATLVGKGYVAILS